MSSKFILSMAGPRVSASAVQDRLSVAGSNGGDHPIPAASNNMYPTVYTNWCGMCCISTSLGLHQLENTGAK